MKLVIIGAGATALSFLDSYLDAYEAGSPLPRRIDIFERSGQFGPGVAYTQDLGSNLLNTRAGSVSPYHDKSGGFPEWSERFADVTASIGSEAFAARPTFGLYLKDQFAAALKRAQRMFIEVTLHRKEVTDLERRGSGFLAQTIDGQQYPADLVILCCGTLPAKRPAFAGDRFFATPYPVRALLRQVHPTERVGILGARLSAIDAIVGLVDNGHKGEIVAYSRGGYLPLVRGTQQRVVLRRLTRQTVEALFRRNGTVRLGDIARLILEDIDLLGGSTENIVPLPAPPEDPIAFFDREIAEAKGDRIWQAVLYATNQLIDFVWQLLPEEDKALFMTRYFSAFMAYRVSIPMDNAIKLRASLKRGILRFARAGHEVSRQEDGCYHVRDASGEVGVFPVLIQATGGPRDVNALDSTFMANLLHRGLISPHRFGGVRIDPVTYEALGADSRTISGLLVLGELTNGTFLFTSALEINAMHAARSVTEMVRRVTLRHHAAVA